MDDEGPMICSICNKSILAGEGRYTGGDHKGIYRHWDCYKPQLDKIDKMLRELKSDINRIGPARKRKRPCRLGEGPTSKRLAVKIAKAIEHDLGLEVKPEDLEFWVQPPAYRGPRWDLAGWGCRVAHPEYPNLKISMHSWSSMTQLVKQKTVSLVSDGTIWSYDVG